jgi:DNA-binding MurR/RpiR family transcriptional regulator
MINIDETNLNSLGQKVLATLAKHAETGAEPKITEAAEICGCSVSQVSKAVKKAGFKGYKQYIRCLYYGDYPQDEVPQELERLKRFIDDFDMSLVEKFTDLILSRQKILFFGYGPSYFCAQYVEYKLRFCTQAYITTPPDEATLLNLLDGNTLLIILTTTGQYRSFEKLISHAKSRGSEVVVLSEEFNQNLMSCCDRYFSLSRHKQASELAPHEKTRTVFFIFFEQVIQRIIELGHSIGTG